MSTIARVESSKYLVGFTVNGSPAYFYPEDSPGNPGSGFTPAHAKTLYEALTGHPDVSDVQVMRTDHWIVDTVDYPITTDDEYSHTVGWTEAGGYTAS